LRKDSYCRAYSQRRNTLSRCKGFSEGQQKPSSGEGEEMGWYGGLLKTAMTAKIGYIETISDSKIDIDIG
jgi:hypothetical protein